RGTAAPGTGAAAPAEGGTMPILPTSLRSGRRWLPRIVATTTCAAATAALTVAPAASAHAPLASVMPRLDHVFVIMEENNGFRDVIGNPAAPNLNSLANTFGLETDYFGVSPDSSESNYVGLLGGSTHNVTSDDPYWMNKINAPSLISQLDQANVSWKAYL